MSKPRGTPTTAGERDSEQLPAHTEARVAEGCSARGHKLAADAREEGLQEGLAEHLRMLQGHLSRNISAELGCFGGLWTPHGRASLQCSSSRSRAITTALPVVAPSGGGDTFPVKQALTCVRLRFCDAMIDQPASTNPRSCQSDTSPIQHWQSRGATTAASATAAMDPHLVVVHGATLSAQPGLRNPTQCDLCAHLRSIMLMRPMCFVAPAPGAIGAVRDFLRHTVEPKTTKSAHRSNANNRHFCASCAPRGPALPPGVFL